ncbi:MAG: gliding motility-associated C-terminal domain-containing protein [Bacteroidota bacterium]
MKAIILNILKSNKVAVALSNKALASFLTLCFTLLTIPMTYSQDWTFQVRSTGGYWEAPENACAIIDNSKVYIPPSLADIPYYWSHFSIRGFEQGIKPGMSIEMRVRNLENLGGIDAFDTALQIFYEGQTISSISLMGAPWAQSYTSAYFMGNQISNQAGLVVDMSNWFTIRLVFVDVNTVEYYYNNQRIAILNGHDHPCFFDLIRIELKGSGELDWLRILDNGQAIYMEDFDACTNFSVWPQAGGGANSDGYLEDSIALCLHQLHQVQVDIPYTCNLLNYEWESHNTKIWDDHTLSPSISPDDSAMLVLHTQVRAPDNLVTNGGFEQGDTGFDTPLNYWYGPLSGTGGFSPNEYVIGMNPNEANPGFADCLDRTTGTTYNMLLIDAPILPNGTAKLWCQTIDVELGHQYELSAWAINVFDIGPAVLQFEVADSLIGPAITPAVDDCDWELMQTNWIADQTGAVEICIVCHDPIRHGHDPAIDDISIYEILNLSDTLHINIANCQEICDNGIDDDLDGLMDCFDTDCTDCAFCEDHYYNHCEVECQAQPDCEGDYEMQSQWVSEASPGNYAFPLAGDIDGDGIPEVVSFKTDSNEIYITNGQTGATERIILTPEELSNGLALAIGDVMPSVQGAEIVAVGKDRIIYTYSYDGVLLFQSTDQVGFTQVYRQAFVNLADFNQDGLPEISIGNQIFSGQTGDLLVSAGPDFSNGSHPQRNKGMFPSVVPVDALPDFYCDNCEGLELVAGNQVFAVDLDNQVIELMVQADDRQYTGIKDGFTSIADIDGDCDLDAVVQTAEGSQHILYAWDLQSPKIIKHFRVPDAASSNGASRVNIADLNGDGDLEFCFMVHPHLYALRNNFALLWKKPIQDGSSSVTCTSVFDFCGDGTFEVVYRDEQYLRVYNGRNGESLTSIPLRSGTHIEYPIILDVDADGETELLISGIIDTLNGEGKIVAFQSANTPWLRTRPVWNQHAFFNTHINDDLSIPQYQQSPHLLGQHINSFMNAHYHPEFPAPDAIAKRKDWQCINEDSLSIRFEICNEGDHPLSGDLPIVIYRGDPRQPFAEKLQDTSLVFTLEVGNCQMIEMDIAGRVGDEIVVVANDNGQRNLPYLLSDFPFTAISECNYQNNFATFTIEAPLATFDIFSSCPNWPSGEIITLISNGQGPFTYDWNPVQQNSPHLIDLPAGIYELTITDSRGCTVAHIIEVDAYEEMYSQIESQDASCPASGDGWADLEMSPLADYTYEWSHEAMTQDADSLFAGQYLVTITDQYGCTLVDQVLIDEPAPLMLVMDVLPPKCFGGGDGMIEIQEFSGGTAPYELSTELPYFYSLDTFPMLFNNRQAGLDTFYFRDFHDCPLDTVIEVSTPIDLSIDLPDRLIIDLGDSLELAPELNFIPSRIQWSPVEALSCDTCKTPIAKPTRNIAYELYVEDEYGCSVRAILEIQVVRAQKLSVPNVFSPNGDGLNDLLMVLGGADIQLIHRFQIFNRWGALLFDQSQFLPNDRDAAWDGISDGIEQAQGVYTYRLEVSYIDGYRKVYWGDITLLR